MKDEFDDLLSNPYEGPAFSATCILVAAIVAAIFRYWYASFPTLIAGAFIIMLIYLGLTS
jgi:hypothetical protein